MNQSLMKRLRKGIKINEPLIGNIFFSRDSDEIFQIDESNLGSQNITEFNFGLYKFDKTIDESWNRFKRAGLLDKNFTEDEKKCSTTLFSASVIYDDINKEYYLDRKLNDKKIENIAKVMNLSKDKLTFCAIK